MQKSTSKFVSGELHKPTSILSIKAEVIFNKKQQDNADLSDQLNKTAL